VELSLSRVHPRVMMLPESPTPHGGSQTKAITPPNHASRDHPGNHPLLSPGIGRSLGRRSSPGCPDHRHSHRHAGGGCSTEHHPQPLHGNPHPVTPTITETPTTTPTFTVTATYFIPSSTPSVTPLPSQTPTPTATPVPTATTPDNGSPTNS